MEMKNFNEMLDMVAGGIDAYKKIVIATSLAPLGLTADMIDNFAKTFRTEKSYYVRYNPLGWFGSTLQDEERYPITEEGFCNVGLTLQNERLFVRNGQMFVTKDEPEITNPLYYSMTTMTSSTLRAMMQSIAYTVEMLEQATKNIKFFVDMSAFYGGR